MISTRANDTHHSHITEDTLRARDGDVQRWNLLANPLPYNTRSHRLERVARIVQDKYALSVANTVPIHHGLSARVIP